MSTEQRFDTETLDEDWLLRWPLPVPHPDGDKETRGKVVIVAGSREMPGAAILAAVGAMRAGAGKLVVATGTSIAALVAAAVPEARVVALRETDAFGIEVAEVDAIAQLVGEGDGLLIGPGMQNEDATAALVMALLPQLTGARIVLDAIAMNVFRSKEGSNSGIDEQGGAPVSIRRSKEAGSSQIILTPHAGEMAHLTGVSKEAIVSDAAHYADSYAKRWGAVVALKGGVTFLSSPDHPPMRHEGGNVGLAVSGSGDVLAGITAGLLARGAPPRQATAWGIALHALAGDSLAERIGPLGFLAREIPDEIPAIMRKFGSKDR